MSEEHYRRLERMYLGADANVGYDPQIRIERGAADVVTPIRPTHLHAAGTVIGAVYFKCLDDAAYFAVASLVEDEFIVTASFQIYLMRPAREGALHARGEALNRSRRLFVAQAVLTDDRGREVARGSGTFVRSGRSLADVPGYAGGL